MRRRGAVFALASALLGSGLGCGSSGTSPAARASEPTAEELPERVAQMLEGADVAYVSDYFSFVGRDARGRVAFALDNNRGRDGEAYQAEHFLLLHDERRGWVDLPGYGPYENARAELLRIPDSPFFSFEGDPGRGLTVRGRLVPLALDLDPLEPEIVRMRGREGVFAMASGRATLTWDGRTLEGRVIHEFLALVGRNRLSRFDWGQLFSSASFQGLYLTTEAGGDLYLHEARGRAVPAALERLGFYHREGETAPTEGLRLEVTRTRQGRGLYRWPQAWTARWQTPAQGEARLEVELSDFQTVRTFLLGGFAMGIAQGTLHLDGEALSVYGWAELIEWLD